MDESVDTKRVEGYAQDVTGSCDGRIEVGAVTEIYVVSLIRSIDTPRSLTEMEAVVLEVEGRDNAERFEDLLYLAIALEAIGVEGLEDEFAAVDGDVFVPESRSGPIAFAQALLDIIGVLGRRFAVLTRERARHRYIRRGRLDTHVSSDEDECGGELGGLGGRHLDLIFGDRESGRRGDCKGCEAVGAEEGDLCTERFEDTDESVDRALAEPRCAGNGDRLVDARSGIGGDETEGRTVVLEIDRAGVGGTINSNECALDHAHIVATIIVVKFRLSPFMDSTKDKMTR